MTTFAVTNNTVWFGRKPASGLHRTVTIPGCAFIPGNSLNFHWSWLNAYYQIRHTRKVNFSWLLSTLSKIYCRLLWMLYLFKFGEWCPLVTPISTNTEVRLEKYWLSRDPRETFTGLPDTGKGWTCLKFWLVSRDPEFLQSSPVWVFKPLVTRAIRWSKISQTAKFQSCQDSTRMIPFIISFVFKSTDIGWRKH